MGALLTYVPELAYGVKGGKLSCLSEARGAPEVQLRRSRPLRKNGRMDDSSQVEEPILGEGVGQGGIKVPPLHTQAGTGSPPLALHNPILLTSGSTAPWRILSSNPSLWNPRAGHHNVKPSCRRRKQVWFKVDEE